MTVVLLANISVPVLTFAGPTVCTEGGRQTLDFFTRIKTIAGWRSDLHLFNVSSARFCAIAANFSISDCSDLNFCLIFVSHLVAEFSPPSLRVFFGRNELTKILGLAEHTSITPTDAGGIGKESTVLTAPHHDHIKQRFGGDCRSIRCDQFPAPCTHFLRPSKSLAVCHPHTREGDGRGSRQR